MSQFSQFAHWFRQGGLFMYPILIVGVLVLAIAAERFWSLRTISAWNARKWIDDLVRLAGRGDLSGAARHCEGVETPVGKVAQSMLVAMQTSKNAEIAAERMRLASEDAALLHLPPLARRVPYLNLLANTATLLGLLGTILGLTGAFAAVGAASPAQRSALLARGISEALNCTAFGLLIAVPALLLHGYFAGRVDSVVEQVDEVTVRLGRSLLDARQEIDARDERRSA
ncbi:MAG: MotA/TolQ/ExbB proton channel family protein [Candidatus Eisenbacteria bacterium]